MSVLAHEGTYPILYGSYEIPVGSGHAPGYLARPDQAGRFPAVLVLPWTGLTSHHKDVCRRLARHGLATVALGLEVAGGDAVVFVDETYEFLMSSEVTWAIQHQLGIVGLGAGGGPGLIYATDHPEIGAVALVSTPLDQDGPVANALSRLSAPVLGLYGADDESLRGPSVDDGRIPHGSFVVYQGVAGGFLDDGAAEYDAAAAADAYRRLIEFFAQALPAPQIERLG
ncbi:MAG: dienelactone hydrolase family protein [Acidimicrobiia bacterium]|nr:dienelactone hydrolase family protein [Acidimicrobiia bacterium]MDH3398819.1 dienelactone hydrolase family protein [Acidimicrobiia bacterium]